MAIKIDVNGIQATVEGAAEEHTMREILKAIEARNKQDGVDTKELNDSLKDLGKSAKDAADDIDQLGSSSLSTSKSLSTFGKSLAATAANIAMSFIKAYDTMAEKPIQAGAALNQAMIDLEVQITKLSIDMFKNAGVGIAGLFGPLGESTQTTADAVAKFGKDVVELGGQIATIGNQFMAAEFEKRVTALGNFAKAGASFAGGMTEIGTLAEQSGIGLLNYSKAVANSREAITDMGLSAGEAAKLVAKGYGALNKVTGISGATLRNELLTLGYSYEEQGEVMAMFMAQQRRAGVALENLAPEALARGTAEYAKNLKVISDITGQDAKKLAERAQVESMRGALAGKLNKQQNEAFQGAFQGLAKIGPEMAPKLQLALTQLLAGKAVRDPAVAGNKYIMDMLKQTVQMVNAGTLNQEAAFSKTTDNLVVTSDQIKATGQDMTDVANAFQVGGIAADMANLNNAFRTVQGRVGEAGKSFESASKQMGATDDVSQGYRDITTTLTDFQNNMESLATDNLPAYAETIAKTTEKFAKVTEAAINYITGKIGLKELGEQMLDSGDASFAGSEARHKKAEAEAKKKKDLIQAENKNLEKSLKVDSKAPAWMKDVAKQQYQESDAAYQQRLKAYKDMDWSKSNAATSKPTAKSDSETNAVKSTTKSELSALEAKHKEIEAEMLRLVTTSAKDAKEREVQNARIKELNAEAAENIRQQRELQKTDATTATTKATPSTKKPGKAKGGISEGPISGYSETLHGREAVVPLPDNKGIPVQLDTGSLSKQLSHQASILTEILDTMKKNNQLTSGILQQSY